ncbi:hypothetical protein SCT_2343 [Sulfuricella sp. T08]|nr:hypothetical protein SCT_2343 [Sulfuricella sp. T08]
MPRSQYARPLRGTQREKATLALLLEATEGFRGQVPLFVIPMDKRELVETLYRLGRAQRGNTYVPGPGSIPAVQRGEPAEFPAGNGLIRQGK